MKISDIKTKVTAALISAGIDESDIWLESEVEVSELTPPCAIIITISEVNKADGARHGTHYDDTSGVTTDYYRLFERQVRVDVRIIDVDEDSLDTKVCDYLAELYDGWTINESDPDEEWIECRSSDIDWIDDQSQLAEEASALVQTHFIGGIFSGDDQKGFDGITVGSGELQSGS